MKITKKKASSVYASKLNRPLYIRPPRCRPRESRFDLMSLAWNSLSGKGRSATRLMLGQAWWEGRVLSWSRRPCRTCSISPRPCSERIADL